MNPNSHLTNPEAQCPYCKHRVEVAAALNGDRGPKAGDFSICFYCEKPSVFTDNLYLRVLTDEDETQPGYKEHIVPLVAAFAADKAARLTSNRTPGMMALPAAPPQQEVRHISKPKPRMKFL